MVLETYGTILWDEHTSIYIIRVPEGREKGPEKVFEKIIAEQFSNLRKEAVTQVQVQEAQRVPYKINPKRNNQDTW